MLAAALLNQSHTMLAPLPPPLSPSTALPFTHFTPQILREVMPALKSAGACEGGCWLWPSITQGAYQSAELIAEQLNIGRSRIVPEYRCASVNIPVMWNLEMGKQVCACVCEAGHYY